MWTVVKRTVGLSAVILGLVFFGMKGLLIGVVFNYWFSYFVNICLVSKHIGYKWYQQVKDILPVGVASVTIALACYLITNQLHLGFYYDGVVKLTFYILLYTGWSVFFKPEAYTFFVNAIPDRFNIVKKMKKKFSLR